MFTLFKKRKLEAIQQGKFPFYSFPDRHKQTALASLASILPVMLASDRASLLLAKCSKHEQVSIKITRDYLEILQPKNSSRSALHLVVLEEGSQAGAFLIQSTNTKKLAQDIDRIIKSCSNFSDDYVFSCSWARGVEARGSQVTPAKSLVSNEDFGSLEERYDIKLPKFYRNFLNSYIQKNSNRSHTVFVRIENLIDGNDRVRDSFPYCEIWQKNWFIVGTDGSGNDYFITTKGNDECVYELDHELVSNADYNPLKSSKFDSLSDVC